MFQETLREFFDTDDFGVSATIKTSAGVTVRTTDVILTTPLHELQLLGEQGVEHGQPKIECPTSELDGVKKDYIFEIEGAVYRVVRREDDGTGISTVWVRRQ